MRSKIIKVLKLLFTPLAFAFLIYFAWQSRGELTKLLESAAIFNLLLATIVWGLLHVLMPMLAVTVFGACGNKIGWRQAFATHAARLPARYLPGGIWHTVGRVIDYRELGVKPRVLSAFVIIENGLAAAVTLAIGGAIVFSMRGTDTLGSIAGLASIAGLIALPLIAVLTNSRVLQNDDQLPAATYLQSLAVVALFWVGATAAFLLYLSAFPEATVTYSAIEMAGVYLFSWGVGFVSIFAPQGIGVFELVASELMKGPIGFMGLAALIAGFRVVVLVADIVVWLIYHASRRTH